MTDADIRADERRQCAKLMCKQCRDGKARFRDGNGTWCHATSVSTTTLGGYLLHCFAGPIWDRDEGTARPPRGHASA